MKRNNCESLDLNLFEEPLMQAAIRDMYIMNFEISHINRVADVGRGRGWGGSEGGSVKAPIRLTAKI